MKNSKSQPDSNLSSVAELRETFCQLLPSLEKFILLAREFCGQNTAVSKPQLCKSCPERDICSEPCVRLQELLPKINSGRGKHENGSEFHDSTLIKIQEEKHLDVFNEYEACKQIFTDKQRVTICLYYRDGKTLSEIAKELDKAISSIDERLKRARNRKEKYDRQLRTERLDYLRKKNESDP